MPEFGERLKTLRKKAGLTQEKLAEILDMSFMTIRRWENGYGSPRLEDIKALSKALGIPESDLLNDPPPNSTGEWIITFKIAEKFEKEEIDLTGNIQPLTTITATPQGCAFRIEADWSMFESEKSLKQLFKRITAEYYDAIRGNGVAFGKIKK